MRNALATALVLGGLALPAQASIISVDIDGSTTGLRNVPQFTITNIGAPGSESLSAFSFTIGDTAFNFDFYRNPSGDLADTTFNEPFLGGTFNQDGVGYDFFSLSGDLAPGESLTFEVDVDPDSSSLGVIVDFTNIFFDNGAAPNSIATAVFSNGATRSYELPDGLSNTPSFQIAVPVPAALPLMLGGIAAFGFVARRRTMA